MTQDKPENKKYAPMYTHPMGTAFRDDFVAFTQDSPSEIAAIMQPSRGLFNAYGYISMAAEDY